MTKRTEFRDYMIASAFLWAMLVGLLLAAALLVVASVQAGAILTAVVIGLVGAVGYWLIIRQMFRAGWLSPVDSKGRHL